MKLEEIREVEKLKPLAEMWRKNSNAAKFGLKTNIETILTDLAMTLDEESALFVVRDGSEIVGMFAVVAMPSFLGEQKIALEKYWYSMPGYHVVGPMLYKEGVKWAAEHECSHLICGASVLASDMHSKLERFYKSMGMKKYETLYIKELNHDNHV